MDNFHNTGWDPHQELITCVHNIGQLVLAVQNGSEIMKELANKYTHQQQVIEQLMFQNRRLNQLLEIQRIEMSRIRQQLEQKPQI
jgi:hypothetical protein